MSSLNLVTVVVRRSNGDSEVTRVVLNGHHARAFVSDETLALPEAKTGQKPLRRPARQVIPAVVTPAYACYTRHAGFQSRGPSLVRHHAR